METVKHDIGHVPILIIEPDGSSTETTGGGAWFEHEPETRDNGGAWLTLTVEVPFGQLAAELVISLPIRGVREIARLMDAPKIQAGDEMISALSGMSVRVIEPAGYDAVLVQERGGQTRISPAHLERPRVRAAGA